MAAIDAPQEMNLKLIVPRIYSRVSVISENCHGHTGGDLLTTNRHRKRNEYSKKWGVCFILSAAR